MNHDFIEPRISAGYTRTIRVNPWKSVAAFVFLCLLVSQLQAQSVRPLIAELGNPAKGRVEYVNDSLTPLNVVLSAKSFTVSETGDISYRSLDPSIHLKLSTTSFRIQPQQSYFVFYEANGDASPAWFVIYAAFSGFALRTQQGMNVRLELPHTVYLLPKQSVDKSQVHVTRAEYDPDSKAVLVEVENTGDYFGRVQQTFLASGKKKQEAPGFPLFPHSKRRIEVPLESAEVPNHVILDFANFKVEEKLGIP
ncbi:MAG TPA: hypothetical protein VMT53_23530 [Terriglobales bacterium]|nr:hypothetical protein [Terriglobales bacterium]